MGMYRSKEDELAKLSSSIFVTNFPNKFSAKELWTVCKQYGTVVDAFIPDRRSKAVVPQWKMKDKVPLDGCKFAWCHKSGSKMSKLDRFLISEGLLNSCPNISSITLDRYLSDHRPISYHDYGPSPFRFFHYWFELEGFDTFVKQTWNDAQVTDSNAISMFMKKMKYLKEKIRMWVKVNKENSKSHKQELSKIDLLLDKGEGSSTLISKRMEILKSIQDFVKLDTMELAQKAKIKWAIEGDENLKYYHGVLNKKRNQLAIRGILVEGRWIESPILVATHRYHSNSKDSRGYIDEVSEPITLIGSLYKIIAKILANRLVVVLEDLVSDVQSAFVAKRQILDGLFRGIQVDSSLQVSHLFYADDAIFMGHWRGEWAPNGKKLIIISVYAPQELREKKMLWDYLILVLKSWNGDVIIMGDFNEVRTQDERHGSIFNAHGADAFNLFISSAGLEEVPLDGCKFTWCHKSGSKMSKLDRFLISEDLLNSCPNISSITLDRYLSDHRPILMRESHHDYGPSPFRFFHYWFELEGFDTFVKQTWNDAQDFVKLDTMELAQKAKIKWAIEGDENLKYYHGVLIKIWEKPTCNSWYLGGRLDGSNLLLVKDEFSSYYACRFNRPPD
ncbi:RNA-directed DNA polymerase, eukaryota [Tanacetum coccineum]